MRITIDAGVFAAAACPKTRQTNPDQPK